MQKMFSLKEDVKTFANILQQLFQFSKQSLSFARGGDLLQIKNNLEEAEKRQNWRCLV